MPDVLIAPQGGGDPTPDELAPLAAAINAALAVESTPIPAKVAPPGTAGVTFWEVINIWVPWDHVRDIAIGAIVREFVVWARRRFREDRDNARPKYVRIIGLDGKVLRSVMLKAATAKPEDTTAEDRDRDRVYRRPDQNP